jgi:hypothetical protein
MLTIEASSIVMNVPIATKRNVAQGFGNSCWGYASFTVTKLGRAVTSRSTDDAWQFIA